MSTVVLSIDAELGWGFHDWDTLPSERVDTARRSWVRLLDLLEEYDVPATWAVVGHLFLDDCDGDHSDHPAPDGWFDRDPGGSAAHHPGWFGRDLVTAIDERDPSHEIACHTFSHVLFGDPGTSPELAVAEIDASLAAADELGVTLDSLVYPRNSVGHRAVLADRGFTCYRGRAPRRRFHGLPTTPGAAVKLATYVAGGPPPIVQPTVDEYGLVDVPASLYLFSFEGRGRSVVEPIAGDPVVRQVRLGLDAVTDTDDGLFHLWLHPNNLTEEADFERMRTILEAIDRLRERDEVDVATMATVADRVRETPEKPAPPTVQP